MKGWPLSGFSLTLGSWALQDLQGQKIDQKLRQSSVTQPKRAWRQGAGTGQQSYPTHA